MRQTWSRFPWRLPRLSPPRFGRSKSSFRFDRLIRQNGAWEIVDWKTDTGKPDAIVDKYAYQMKLYALALRKSLPQAERMSV